MISINNLREVLYIFAPFIIVCYFLLLSIFNTDMKGIIYLIGLVISCISTIFIGNGIVGKFNNKDKEALCNIITINHISEFSNIPISLTIYCFTLAYLTFTMLSLTPIFIIRAMIPILFLVVLIGMDILWISGKKCFGIEQISTAVGLSTLFGVGWGYIINSINNKSLQYYTSEDNTCTMPKRRMFKVNRLYKNKNKDDVDKLYGKK